MEDINLTDLSLWGQVEIITIDEAALLWAGINPIHCINFEDSSKYPRRQYNQACISRRIFLSGVASGTLPTHELWCYQMDSYGNYESLYQHVDKQLPRMQEISTNSTTILMNVLISWTECKRIKTIKQQINEERKNATIAKQLPIPTEIINQQPQPPKLLDYKPKHNNTAYEVLVSIMKDYYDTIPDGGKPLKSLALREEIAKRYELSKGVKPTQNIIGMIDKLARPEEFKK